MSETPEQWFGEAQSAGTVQVATNRDGSQRAMPMAWEWTHLPEPGQQAGGQGIGWYYGVTLDGCKLPWIARRHDSRGRN